MASTDVPDYSPPSSSRPAPLRPVQPTVRVTDRRLAADLPIRITPPVQSDSPRGHSPPPPPPHQSPAASPLSTHPERRTHTSRPMPSVAPHGPSCLLNPAPGVILTIHPYDPSLRSILTIHPYGPSLRSILTVHPNAPPNVPKSVNLGGRGHLMVDNFPLSPSILEVNFPFPTPTLTLATAISPKSQLFSILIKLTGYSPHFAVNFPSQRLYRLKFSTQTSK